MLRAPLSSIALAALAFACNDYGVTVQPAPDAPAVSIDPEQPKTEDMLHAVVDYAESNVTYAYTWFVDGRRVEDLDSDTVPPNLTEGDPVLIGSTPTPYTWANGFEVSPNFLSVYWNRSSPGLEIFRITLI